MKKSTKAILLTAITMTFSSLNACEERYAAYGPAPDYYDNTNDVTKSMIIEEQRSLINNNEEKK